MERTGHHCRGEEVMVNDNGRPEPEEKMFRDRKERNQENGENSRKKGTY